MLQKKHTSGCKQQREVDVRAVRANIERLHAEYPEAPVVIQPHTESRTDTTVRIMDQARQAGVRDIKLGEVP